MTLAFAVLGPLRPGSAVASGRAVTPLPMVRVASPAGLEAVLETRAPLAEEQWDAIVIHHSGSPADSPVSLDEQHKQIGLRGLGYHFVVGNGVRMGDGEVHVAYRWLDQLPGAHVAGAAGTEMNRRAIGICLVGDGDRRAFSDTQIRRVMQLVTLLRERAGISAERVYLHRDLATTTSPGRYFPEAQFDELLSVRP